MQKRDMTKPLDRYLSPIDVWAMAFGCMVGWGVFAMPGTTFLPVAGPATGRKTVPGMANTPQPTMQPKASAQTSIGER